jgi:adenosine kinase
MNVITQIFVLNLSAPFIPQFFGVQLQQILPYTDIVICNETEAEAWASATGLAQSDLSSIAKALANQPKANAARPRTVVITHGSESTTVVTANDIENAKIYPVHALSDSEIVDTNGAGDAFAGGFIGAYVTGKSLEECVEAGHKMGSMCVQLVRACLISLVLYALMSTSVGWSSVQVAEGQHLVNLLTLV